MNLFNYNTLEVHLEKETKSANLTIFEEYITTELIFELESFFNWVANKIEIDCLYIKNNNPYFSKGIDLNHWKTLDTKRVNQNLKTLQKLTYISYLLPQTIIVDMGLGAKGLGAELILTGDVRIAHENTTIQFDHLDKGLVPCSGGIGFLSEIVGPSFTRNWIMLGKKIKTSELINSGLVIDTYSENQTELVNVIKNKIHSQNSVARIQAKRSLLDTINKSFEAAREFESRYALGVLGTNDWKKEENTNPKDLRTLLQSV